VSTASRDDRSRWAPSAPELGARLALVVGRAVGQHHGPLVAGTALTRTDVTDAAWDVASVVREHVAGTEAPTALPVSVQRLVTIAARDGAALSLVTRLLRGLQAELLDEHLRRPGGSGQRAEVSRLFDAIDLLLEQVSAAYVAERRRLGTRPDRQRRARVLEILAGASGGGGLGYELGGPHVAIVLSGTRAPADVRALLQELGHPSLLVEGVGGATWAWVACEVCEDDVVAALERLERGDTAAGVSGPERGVEGFRATHRKAALALRLGHRHGSRATTFGAVALEALVFGGEPLAREFVAAELAELGGPGRRNAVLRETLARYFATGSSIRAADQLGVAERTVTYRLRHAERVLGRPLHVRRAELETALRLHETFLRRDGGQVLTDGASEEA